MSSQVINEYKQLRSVIEGIYYKFLEKGDGADHAKNYVESIPKEPAVYLQGQTEILGEVSKFLSEAYDRSRYVSGLERARQTNG